MLLSCSQGCDARGAMTIKLICKPVRFISVEPIEGRALLLHLPTRCKVFRVLLQYYY